MMFNVQPCYDAASPHSAFVRALNSITPQQTATIAQAVCAASPDGWITAIQDDYDGYQSVLVEPRAADEVQTCYFVSGTAQRLDLFAAHDDQLVPVGCFSHVQELCNKLVSLIGD